MEELAAEVRVALPYITELRMKLLMKYFEENGVHSKGDVSKVEAVDLVNMLGTTDAKKLAAYFHYGRLFHNVNDQGARTAELNGMKVAYEELNTKLDEQRARRQQIHEETLRDVDQNVLQISEIHDARLMDIQKTETQASRVHAEMLQRMQEEDRLRAERRAQRQRETEEEIRRLEAERRNPARAMQQGFSAGIKLAKEVWDTFKR
ncbi:uncharacterized protein LOC144150145 [Haemaphysalis longicornis]